MNYPTPQAQVPEAQIPDGPLPRFCASGTLLCSGLNPCPACLKLIETNILPKLLLMTGITRRDTAQALMSAWPVAWTQFHNYLETNPGLAQVTDVRPLLEAFQIVMHLQANQAQQQTLNGAGPAPGGPVEQVLGGADDDPFATSPADPNVMNPEQLAAAKAHDAAAQAPAPPADDGTLLGESVDLMGPLDKGQMQKIFAKAKALVEPIEAPEAPEPSEQVAPETALAVAEAEVPASESAAAETEQKEE